MRFLDLPIRLRLYIAANTLLLFPVGYLVSREPRPQNWPLLGALLLFALLFSTWRVELSISQAKVTPTFAILCLAMLLSGVQAAILCAVLGAVLSTCFKRSLGWKVQVAKPPLHRVLFNAANCALACAISALAFRSIYGLFGNHDAGMLLGLIAFTACYFLVSAVGVSLAVALQSQRPWGKVLQGFFWTAPGYFACASAAVAIQALSRWMGLWSLTLLPWLYLVYYFYETYMARLAHIQQLNELNQAIIASLATAIDAKDHHTAAHINRVQFYATSLAKAVGVTPAELEAVRTGALVHDIGKLGIPDHILGKPGKLTQDEFRRIQSHVTIGAEILRPIPFPFPVVDVVLTHHERWDGAGYPRGLMEEEIPVGGRIISVVDVFDAITSDRPYRRAMTQEEAVRMLREGAGKQFDPQLVEQFARILPRVRVEIERMEEAELARQAAVPHRDDEGAALIRISQAAAAKAAVCEVAHALAEQDALEGVLNVTVHQALALMPADTAVLYLRTPHEPVLLAVATDGLHHERLIGMTVQVGEGAAGWVAEHRKPQLNVAAALDVARRFAPGENVELSSATAVPLLQPGNFLGVLAIYTTAYRAISEKHLDVLNLLAEHAAGAILTIRASERQAAPKESEARVSDPLTGLPTCRSLIRQLELLAFRDGPGARSPFSVLLVDLDGFKQVNDRLGQNRGDAFLVAVGAALSDLARPGDLVCRYAGDEFALVRPDCARQQAEQVVQQVRSTIAALRSPLEDSPVSASVGVASFPEDARDTRSLLSTADRRMYEDKLERRQRRAETPESASVL